MRILRSVANLPDACKGAVIALGNFDGVHLGHQAILKQAAELAKADNAPFAVMTFEPHPREFFNPSQAPLRLYSFRQKAELMARFGVDLLFALRFNKTLSQMSAECFVEDILVKNLGVRHIVTGYDFAFGKGRGGDCTFLTQKSHAHGFGFWAHEPVVSAQSATISSSAVRALLTQGDIASASAMLGHPYSISGRVMRGEQRGRKMGFPTLNLSLKKRFTPRLGIYAGHVQFAGERERYQAAISIGLNPTFSLTEPRLEAHCLDMNRDMYGKRATVELAGFLRDEKKFESAEQLAAHMAQDCANARILLEKLHA